MICQWAIAVGTILVAVFAIFGNEMRMLLFGPKLHVALKDPRGESIQWSDGVNSRYYHLRVWNRGRIPAKNVRVCINTLNRLDADGTMRPIPLSGHIQLAWQWEESNPQFQTIGADSTCDLGYLKEGESFKLKTIFDPIAYNFTIAKGERMIVGIIALSDEAKSTELKLEIAWDGIWSDDPEKMRNHMVINPFPALNP